VTGLEFREPSAEFGQLGRREPQDRFLDIFDCHGRRNSTPASELEEPVAGKPGCNCLSAAGDRGWQTRSAPTETDYVAGHVGLELGNVIANYLSESSDRFAGIQPNSGLGDCSRIRSPGHTKISPGMLARRWPLAEWQACRDFGPV